MNPTAMLATVGGSPEPILKAIRQEQPGVVIFFASHESRDEVFTKILPQIENAPPHGLVITDDEQDLGHCAFALLEEVPRELKKLGLNTRWPELIAYTGGTKTMSAAAVWASSHYPCRFLYVGAETAGRNRGGLGVAITGKEKLIDVQNPWNEVAWHEARRAFGLFNAAQYATAARELDHVREHLDNAELKYFLESLSDIFHGYHAWDIFNHRQAVRLIGKRFQSFRDTAAAHEKLFPALRAFADEVSRQFSALKPLADDVNAYTEMAMDLLANAKRRARLEQKYEDATARCYAAIERFGKGRMKENHSINPDDVDAERLPDELRDEYVRRHTNEKGKIQIGLMAVYRLLKVLQDPVGLRFKEREMEIRSHLDQRNQSILAHGTRPMDQEKFTALFQDALYLIESAPQDLVRFPHIALDA